MWTDLLSVSSESFTLMVRWQSAAQIKRLPQLRRKLEKSQMEIASQTCALLVGVRKLAMANYPFTSEQWEEKIYKPFISNAEHNLLLHLQGLIHARPAELDLNGIPLIGDMIDEHTRASDIAITGMAQSDKLQRDIDITEFELFTKKWSPICQLSTHTSVSKGHQSPMGRRRR